MDFGHKPWAAYRALMSGRLVGLDNCPGVQPVGMGNTWQRILAKCAQVVMEGGCQADLQDGTALRWPGGGD